MVYIGATGKKLWKLVRQANSTGTAVARIRSDLYKYVYAFRRIFLYVCDNFDDAEHACIELAWLHEYIRILCTNLSTRLCSVT